MPLVSGAKGKEQAEQIDQRNRAGGGTQPAQCRYQEAGQEGPCRCQNAADVEAESGTGCLIFAGHFVGLLTPIAVFDALGISHGAKQMLAIVAGGLAGLMCLVGIAMLTHRRLFDARIRATSSFGDTVVLLLLFAQLLLGLGTIPVSMQHLDGHEMTKFMEWAQRIWTFRGGAADLVADAHPIFRAHLTLGLTIFLVFPFTRLVHIFSAPVWYLGRRGYQLVRTKRKVAPAE